MPGTNGFASPTGVLGRLRRSSSTDEQLLRRARLGDEPAFEELYRRYHAAVLGYCLARLADRHAAEDAAQEVFARAAGASAPEIGNVKSWLFTIAHNAVVDSIRRRKPDSALVDLEAVIDSADFASEESAFAALDTVTNVFIALRRLPARERTALIMREFQDRPSAEIAAELDTRPANVDVIVSRARAAFGRAYAEVVELPPACRQATETIYRELGSGASEQRLAALQSHRAVCPRCEAEYRRAHAPRYLGALAPLLWPGLRIPSPHALLQQMRSLIEPAVPLLDRAGPSGWSTAIRAALAVAVVGVALTPQLPDGTARTPAAAPGPDATLAALSELHAERLPTKIDAHPDAMTDTHAAAMGDAAPMQGFHAEAHPMEYTTQPQHGTSVQDHTTSDTHATTEAPMGTHDAGVTDPAGWTHDHSPMP